MWQVMIDHWQIFHTQVLDTSEVGQKNKPKLKRQRNNNAILA